MAPKKRSSEGDSAEQLPKRVTRSSSARLTRSVNRSVSMSITSPTPTTPKKIAAKKIKTEPGVDEGTSSAVDEGTLAVAVADAGKTVVIEHCKQCNSFKTRALQVKKGLEDGVPGITVLINPEKPRKGCFEIREEGGETFITLLDMPRPFQPMKDLDMEKVITDIIEKIK